METVEACEAYLDGLGISLWADWEIQNTERRKLAARWLARQVEAVEAVRNEHDFPSQGGAVKRPSELIREALGPSTVKRPDASLGSDPLNLATPGLNLQKGY